MMSLSSEPLTIESSNHCLKFNHKSLRYANMMFVGFIIVIIIFFGVNAAPVNNLLAI